MKRKLALFLSAFGGLIAPLTVAISCTQREPIKPVQLPKQEDPSSTNPQPKEVSPEEAAKIASLKESVSTEEKLKRMSENTIVLLKDSAKDKTVNDASSEDIYPVFDKHFLDYSKEVKTQVSLVSVEETKAKFSVAFSKVLSNGQSRSFSKVFEVDGYKTQQPAEQ
ncbi:Uncharacterised protein [Mycoplasmopsis citelli]|uniref:Lipoprotein n=1 Tax=Mycoplasmopsis citelli TaxID=171281 RepID=A0A449B1R6_9BACT|nr:hypothetical protein [Mycoplasmopsis citelli]VEU74511.1 Uncharacterised protein [Mycoplasmopsis citelli]